MFTNHQKSFRYRITRSLELTAVIAALASLAGDASARSLSCPANSGTPLPALTAKGGAIIHTHAFETRDRLYVAGSVRRSPGFASSGSEVSVELLDRQGRLLAEQRDKVGSPPHPRSAGGRSRRSSFVVSFPLEVARRAVCIRVSLRSASPSTPGTSGLRPR